MNAIDTKARTTVQTGSFGSGVTVSKPGSAKGAGGVNLKTPYESIAAVSEGTPLNKGRLNGGTERNYNGRGPASIPQPPMADPATQP